ncbi:MAG: shikimate kinase [Meiothermus sp.]|nr:shikimate kinase [Meiothermus sp.]
MPLERVVVFGFAGSGKSTLARQLAQRLGLEYFETDALHWNPGWVGTPTPQFREKIEAATAGVRWATEGNYSQVRDIYLKRADTVIWLDYPFWFTYLRLLRRTLGRILDRQPICNGNYETFGGAFLSRKSLLLYALQSRWRMWREGTDYSSRWDTYPHLEVLRFRRAKETQAWLEGLKDGGQRAAGA